MPQPQDGLTLWLTHALGPALTAALTRNATLIAVCLTAALAFLILLPVLNRGLTRASLFRKTQAEIDHHLDTLLRRRAQLLQKDPYGRWKTEKWEKEIDYFIAHQIAPRLSRAELAALARNRTRIAALLDRTAAAAETARPTAPDDMTPAEFEIYCARSLGAAGWDARVTQQSRDQGVDVIAVLGGVRLVLQCKLYARPVGNKSVQEAAAARLHEQADFAAVVSNNRFTPAAEQLAATTGVLLLHYRDLATLADRLAERSHP